MIHFDTNFLIQSLVAESPAHRQFQAWADGRKALGISSIVWAEFLCGPLDAKAESLARQTFPNPEPFLAVDAALAAALFNQTGRRSRSLADCMIATVAIRCGAELATLNAGDFLSIVPHGLVLS